MTLWNATGLERAARKHNQAAEWLAAWQRVVEAEDTQWRSLVDVRRTYPHADGVNLGRGKNRVTVTVFNAGGNDFRLLTLINYARQIVQFEALLTHAEYSSDRWKRQYS